VEPRGKEARVANERVQEAGKVFPEIMDAPDKGVPHWVMQRAHCAAIIPGMKNGGFIFGARYGKGVITCRDGHGGWTAPSTVRIEGGSFGLQIGGGEIDVVLFVMNEDGKNKLMKSKFTLGGEAAAMGGPIGRTAKAETDAWMHAKILSYSRSRGVFAGVVVEGATLRPDNDDNNALYGRPVTSGEILNGHYAAPRSARALITSLRRHSRYEL
jgi:lipid-binding SYLF domain-containing protein